MWNGSDILYHGSLWFLIIFVILYILFQLHLLPPSLARIISRLSFYPTWPITYFIYRKNYYTFIDSHVVLGAVPISFMPHINELYTMGVRAVINLCDEYQGPISLYKKLHIVQLHLPIIDHMEPTFEILQEGIQFIQYHKNQGHQVYIHCKSGKGRSAALAYCWLLYARKMTLMEAQSYLLSKRRVRTKLYQQKDIIKYYHYLQNNSKSGVY